MLRKNSLRYFSRIVIYFLNPFPYTEIEQSFGKEDFAWTRLL